MKLAISNIAWNRNEERDVQKLLVNEQVKAIEIAPGMIWDNPLKTSSLEIVKYKKFWKSSSIDIVAMQGLLFGREDLKLFSDMQSRKNMHDYMVKIIELAARLDITRLVFGSPKNRVIPEHMELSNAFDIAFDFFNSLGFAAEKYGIYICIEANPKIYGTNFLNTTESVVQFVSDLAHPSIKVQLDIGAMTVNKDDYKKIINDTAPFVGHIHISEPNLLPIPQKEADHERFAKLLTKQFPNHYMSIEMRGNKDRLNSEQIRKTLSFVKKIYKIT